MSRTLVVGDLHCKQRVVLPTVEEYLNKNTDVKTVVFLGDYVDDYNVTGEYMIDQLKYHVKWYNSVKDNVNVVHLCGNHDWSYVVKDSVVASGHIYDVEEDVQHLLNRLNMSMACVIGPFLTTHAGLTQEWARSCEELKDTDAFKACDVLNNMFLEKDTRLNKCGKSRGGQGYSGPLWADASELYDSSYNQIVGHTPVSTPTIVRGLPHSPKNNAVLLCDTLSSSASGLPWGNGHLVLVNEDGTLNTVHIPDWSQKVKEYQNSVMDDVLSTFVNSYYVIDKKFKDISL